MTKLENEKRAIFITAFCIVLLIFIWDAANNALYVKDAMFAMAVLAFFYWIEKKHPLPLWAIGVGIIPVFIHIFGVSFNLFGMMIFDIGYDKYAHFTSSFALTVLSFYWLISNSHKHYVKKAFAAVLIVLGLGSLNEINEFIGSQYLHITGPTMFSQGDSLPRIRGDFQIFDTWWDMIFNFGGTMLAWLICIGITWYKHNIIEKRWKKRRR